MTASLSDLLGSVARKTAGAALGLGLTVSLVSPVVAQTAPTPAAAPPAPAVAAATQAAPVVMGNPALWVIRDADSTIYLFGTFHALRPTTQWRTPAVEQALAASRELWLEIEDPENPAALQPLIMQLGLSPATPLSSRLNDADKALLAAAAQRAGMPPQALEPMRPWLAGLTLAVAPLIQAGYDPTKGVDTLLRQAAVERGMTIRAFETPEQQFRFFADLPPEQELAFLRSALEDFEEGPAMIDRLAVDWAEGDVSGIERLMVDEMRADSPELYRVLIVNRNAAWTTRIRQMLAGSGTAFIAVGAGHLAGPDSVQAMLARNGVQAQRVNAPATAR